MTVVASTQKYTEWRDCILNDTSAHLDNTLPFTLVHAGK